MIVEGATSLVKSAIDEMGEKGIELSSEARNNFVKKLMVVTCSDSGDSKTVTMV